MARYSVTVADETGRYGGFAARITSNTLAAADLWQTHLQREADIEISVVVRDLGPSILAQASSPGSGFIGPYAGYSLYQAGMAYELQTGIDPNGAEPDVSIDLNASFIGAMWFDPTPQSDDGDVPAASYDAISLLLHEIGHALGFTGYRNNLTGALTGSAMSMYDRYIDMRSDGPFFIGPFAMQAYGGPVPLAVGSLAHYGNRGGLGAELADNVMARALAAGVRREVSALDRAILRDVGLDVVAGATTLLGRHDQYRISVTEDLRLRVEDQRPMPDRIRLIQGTEPLRFADGTALFDLSGAAAKVARLYGGALGRAPDAGGLEHHAALLNARTISLSSMAQAFLASPEFGTRFGAPDNAGFVTRLYANVLGRAPDAAGLAGWVGGLAGGLARDALLLGFTESVENRVATLTTIGDGKVAEAYRLYRAALSRAPDQDGLANWTGHVDRGTKLREIAQHFIMSAEFDAKYGALGNADFVTTMYANALGRTPDAGGHAGWTQALATGLSRAEVLVGFSNSTENRAATAAATHDGWVFVR